ncbi:unnamed protein product [Paramecium primaurelia]|uniref:Transmembrane protein n=1 Tax=Paramecium primaurelia TaxID=5886 RepID=A0A8S1NYQ7_PARPR|nr:unnamed protein product [Paramecium primaurelia]
MYQLFLISILLIKEIQSETIVKCYYEYDDSTLEIDETRPQKYTLSLQTNSPDLNSKGFGFWSKYIHNKGFTPQYQGPMPFIDPNCYSSKCKFYGILLMKILDSYSNLFGALILNMMDNPIRLTHDFYLYPIGPNQQYFAQIYFDASQYENIWIYTSFVYSMNDQTIRLFTNIGSQLKTFTYSIFSDKINIQLGGSLNLNQNSFYGKKPYDFKGYISPIQEYEAFQFMDDFFANLFSKCFFQEQQTKAEIYELKYFEPQIFVGLVIYFNYHETIINNRYVLKCWIKQDYLEAYNFYKTEYGEDHMQLMQAIFRIDSPFGINTNFVGDVVARFFYTVDFQNNDQTNINFQTEFYKIPILTPKYQDQSLREFDTLTINGQNLYDLTQKWHYFILEYGRTPSENGGKLQLRFYFEDQEPQIYNLGTQNYNSQFTGYIITLTLQLYEETFRTSRTKLEKITFITGFQGDNEDKQDCYKSCKYCNGPMNYQCTSCYEEYNQFLTQFNQCECKYLYTYNENTNRCDKIEDQHGLTFYQESVSQFCQFGYFQVFYENQYFCIRCPQYHIVNLFCGDCYFQFQTWYLKPICTFDLIQEKDSYAYMKHIRLNIQIDVYYLNSGLELQILEGASEFCEDTLHGCQISNKYHLNQQIKIRCKNNHFYENSVCKICDPYCINCQSEHICLECIESHYFNLISNRCVLCSPQCLTCKTDINSEFGEKCLSCISSYAATNQGQCQKCGLNCQYCKEDYNQQNKQYFLRCLKCFDDKIMAIRFNGIDCLVIEKSNCQYVMIISKSQSIKYNSYSYNFQPSNDLSDELAVCALCDPDYVYVVDIAQCQVIQEEVACLIGIFHEFPGDLFFTGIQKTCLVGQYSYGALSFIGESNCQNYVTHCNFCFIQYTYSPNYCLECFDGYYINRLGGECLRCPESLNCKTCFQQSVGYYDQWKIKTAILNQFLKMRNDERFFFAYHDFSQNPNDYETICMSCFEGYLLKNGKCIKYCDSTCESCIFKNDQYFCQSCGKNKYHNQLSVIQYQCSDCPSYCELCRERTDEEIFKLNPLFIKTNQNQIFTYQCLLPFLNNKNIYYDQIFGQFISCKDILQCENVLNIELNLFCSYEDYQTQLSSITDQNLQKEFQMKNVVFQSLIKSNIESNSFIFYETNDIFEILNKLNVRRIKIFLKSQQQQTCSIDQFGYISQKFSKYVFSTIDIQLNLISEIEQPLILEIVDDLSFVDFSFVRMQNIKISIKENINTKIINVYGFQSISLELEKVIITSQAQINSTLFNFQCNQLNSLLFNQVSLENIKIDNQNLRSIFSFQYVKHQNQIIIQNFNISNSNLIYTNIFEIKSLEKQSIFLYNLNIDSELVNCSLLATSIEIQVVTIFNFFITGIMKQTHPFISLQNVVFANIENFTIKSMKLINSTLLQLEKRTRITQFVIQTCETQGYFKFIQNNIPKQSTSDQLQYSIIELIVENLSLSYQTQILDLQSFSSTTSELELSNIKLLNNNLNELQQENQYLFNIELQNVKIIDCNIIRGNGLSEFQFSNLLFLRFINLKITQSQITLLHQYFECSSMQKFKNQHPNLIKVMDVINVFFDYLIIERINILNSGLLLFQKQSQTQSSSEDAIIFKNLNLKDNIIITSLNDAYASLISIMSNQRIVVNITQATISGNQLHNYEQNIQMPSAVSLIINCPSGSINLQNNYFYNNFATNTPDTIINIVAKQIIFDRIQFINNSIYNISSLLNNIVYGFSNDQVIFYSNLQSIFQLQNFVGNAYLSADQVTGSNTIIQNSQGKNGVGLYIKAKFTKLNRIQFLNLKTFFYFNEENGGCIFLEIPSSECQVLIQNIIANNIISKDYGGLIYIKSDYDNLNLTLQNLTVSQCISYKGTVLHASFLNNTLSNRITINQLYISNQYNAFQNYIKQIVENQIILNKFNERVSVYLENAIVYLSDIIIKNLFGESILLSLYQENANLNSIKVLNGNILKQKLIHMQPKTNQNTFILIQAFSVINVQEFTQPQKQCNVSYIENKNNQKNMQCQVINQKPQNNLIVDIQQDYSKEIECLHFLFISSAQIDQQALIMINLNTESHTIELSDINLINNNLSNSLNGLIFIQLSEIYQDNFQISLKKLSIKNNQCGKVGCLYINSIIFDENKIIPTINNRLLAQDYEKIVQEIKHDINIVNYECIGNLADYGTCLFSNHTNIQLKNSLFYNNTANRIGGTIYFIGKQSKLFLIDCQISSNYAQVAGAMYFDDSIAQDMNKSNTILMDNRASYYGNNNVQAPVHLSITLNNKNLLQTFKVEESRNQLKEQINSLNINHIIYLPSGTPISLYRKFNSEMQILEQEEYKFRILALDNQFTQIKNLKNTQCNIETQVYNLTSKTYLQVSNNTYISKNSVIFNEKTNDYNLDDMIIYFDNNNTGKSYLQLIITCNSIKIPQYDETNQIIQQFHNNYQLIININTFKCRVGEIKSLTDQSCYECDYNLEQYSITLDSNKCNIRDEQTTISVTSFQLNLKQGFWRPYFDNNYIEQCYNYNENCLGGWKYGMDSCYLGHYGALCELCDIENIRGDGSFSTAQEYSCGSCDDISFNVVQIIAFSLWTLFTIVLSVKGAITTQHSFLESPFLIKILTNYLQIISSLTSFKLNLPVNFFYFLNGVGNPIQRVSYSMDCQLIQMTSLDIHYSRLIWQLLFPCIYFFMLGILYAIFILMKQVKYRSPIIMTAVIYMYIYFQPTLIGSFIAMVSTRTIANVPWIQAYVAYRFDTIIHQRWVYILCVPMLSLFGVIIPFGFLLCLVYNKDKLQYKRGKSLFGYLYYEYKPQTYFWEIIKIVTKELVIVFLIFYEDSIILKGSLIFFILLCYWSLNLKFIPFRTSRLNLLDYQSSIICGVSMIFGICLSMDQQQQFQNISTVLFFTLIIINIFMLLKMLLYILNAYSKEMVTSLDQIKLKILQILPNRFKSNDSICQRILKTQAETNQRVKANILKLKTALKKHQSKSQKPKVTIINPSITTENQLISLDFKNSIQQKIKI